MKITLIGTGAMYTKYNSASTLINNNLIIDMPNGTVKQLLKNNYDITNIKNILITHLHGDHTADIPFFLKYVFNIRKIKNSINIIGPIGIKKKIIELFNAYNFENEEQINTYFNLNIIEVLEETINIEEYKIISYQVIHGLEKPSLGYVIDDKLGITGDSRLCANIEKIFLNSKLVISDTSSINGDSCHLGINDIKYLVEKYDTKIITTHMMDATRKKLLEEPIRNVNIVEDFYNTEI